MEMNSLLLPALIRLRRRLNWEVARFQRLNGRKGMTWIKWSTGIRPRWNWRLNYGWLIECPNRGARSRAVNMMYIPLPWRIAKYSCFRIDQSLNSQLRYFEVSQIALASQRLSSTATPTLPSRQKPHRNYYTKYLNVQCSRLKIN